VVVFGFGAALSHLLRAESSEPATASEVNPEAAPEPLPAPVPESTPEGVPETAPLSAPKIAPRSTGRVKAKPTAKRAKAKGVDLADLYAAGLAAGKVPSLRRIRSDMRVGQPKAQQIQAELTAFLTERLPVAA
jgi:hypothetical protein